MTIYIYESLSRKKKEFIPINQDDVRIYACGPTVYSYAHIGNARMSVVTDLLVNVLRTKFKNVRFVSNITDIDDKIIEAAKSENKPIKEITSKYSKIYNQDMAMLGVGLPDFQPKATDHINEIILMIEKLIKNNCAYISEGNVLFDVTKYKYYGSLSKRTKEEQISGSRIEVGKYKKNDADFVLWKPSNENEPGWNSPWGYGRPGWHIECSAMSEKCLGIPFDIHCGGVDLTFPHHENEIAQSCSAHKTNLQPQEFCKYWFHNGFVTVNGEKMSKSLGNISLVNDLLKNFTGSAIRLSLLSSHYRQPMDWSEKILQQSKKTLEKFQEMSADHTDKEVEYLNYEPYVNDFLQDLYDDLNTPKALAKINIFFDKSKKDKTQKKIIFSSIIKCFEILGIDLENPKDKFVMENDQEKKIILDMIDERTKARKRKDFKKADEIRDKLKEMKVDIEDSSEGTLWKKN